MAILDDITIIGAPGDITSVLPNLRTGLARIGLELSQSKCAWLGPSAPPGPDPLPVVQSVKIGGITLPRGQPQIDAATAVLERATAHSRWAITNLPLTCSVPLIKHCIIPSVVHLLRADAVPAALATHFDDTIHDLLASALAIPAQSCHRLQLPVRFGGLGVPSLATSLAPAFVAHAATAITTARCPGFLAPDTNPASIRFRFHAVRAQLNLGWDAGRLTHVCGTPPSHTPVPSPVQHTLVELVYRTRALHAGIPLVAPPGACGSWTGDTLNACATAASSLSDGAYALTVRTHLGVPRPIPGPCLRCGTTSTHPDHADRCPDLKGARTRRHNALAQALVAAAHAGIGVTVATLETTMAGRMADGSSRPLGRGAGHRRCDVSIATGAHTTYVEIKTLLGDADDVVAIVRNTVQEYQAAGLDKPLVVAFATNGSYSSSTRELCQRLARDTHQELLDISGRLACTFAAASWDAVAQCHPHITPSSIPPTSTTQIPRITPSSARASRLASGPGAPR